MHKVVRDRGERQKVQRKRRKATEKGLPMIITPWLKNRTDKRRYSKKELGQSSPRKPKKGPDAAGKTVQKILPSRKKRCRGGWLSKKKGKNQKNDWKSQGQKRKAPERVVGSGPGEEKRGGG